MCRKYQALGRRQYIDNLFIAVSWVWKTGSAAVSVSVSDTPTFNDWAHYDGHKRPSNLSFDEEKSNVTKADAASGAFSAEPSDFSV